MMRLEVVDSTGGSGVLFCGVTGLVVGGGGTGAFAVEGSREVASF